MSHLFSSKKMTWISAAALLSLGYIFICIITFTLHKNNNLEMNIENEVLLSELKQLKSLKEESSNIDAIKRKIQNLFSMLDEIQTDSNINEIIKNGSLKSNCNVISLENSSSQNKKQTNELRSRKIKLRCSYKELRNFLAYIENINSWLSLDEIIIDKNKKKLNSILTLNIYDKNK